MINNFTKASLLGLILSLSLAGCKKHENLSETPLVSLKAAEDYYAAHPEFFIFSSIDKLPKDLIWQDGMDQPEFANIGAPKGGTMHLSIASFPRTFRGIGPDSNTGMRSQLYENNGLSLIDVHPNTRAFIPAIAEAWALGGDGKTVYFKINPRARYSDGAAVRVDDFFYTFYFMRSPCLQAPFYNNWYRDQYKSITRFDDLTFAIELPHGSPVPIFDANIGPTPGHYYGDLTIDFPKRYQWIFPPTTGAYELKPDGFVKGRSVTLTRLKDWWAQDQRYYRGRFNVDSIHYRVVRDFPKAFQLFKKGELDAIDLALPEYWYNKSDISEIKKGYIDRAVFYNDLPRPVSGLFLNQAVGILKDANVREGVAYALDLDSVIAIYLHGDYKRLRTCAEGYGPYTNNEIPLIPFSPEKAAECFAKAGFKTRGEDGILINQKGERLKFTITLNTGPLEPLYSLLQSKAKAAGLDIQIEALDSLTIYKKVISKKHEATASSFIGSFEFYPQAFEQFYHSSNAFKEGSNNITNMVDPALDHLIDMYSATADPTLLQQLSRSMQAYVADSYAFIPTWYCPFYRVGYWRWVEFPAGFNVAVSMDPWAYGLYWINLDKKTETWAAKNEGKSFLPQTIIYNQFEVK